MNTLVIYFLIPFLLFIGYLIVNRKFKWTTKSYVNNFIYDLKNDPFETLLPFFFGTILWPLVVIFIIIMGLVRILPTIFIALFPNDPPENDYNNNNS